MLVARQPTKIRLAGDASEVLTECAAQEACSFWFKGRATGSHALSMLSLVRIKTTARKQRVRRQSAKTRLSGYALPQIEKRNSHEVAKASSRGREPTVGFSDHPLALGVL